MLILKDISVVDIPDTKDVKFCFELTGDKKPLRLCASSAAEKKVCIHTHPSLQFVRSIRPSVHCEELQPPTFSYGTNIRGRSSAIHVSSLNCWSLRATDRQIDRTTE